VGSFARLPSFDQDDRDHHFDHIVGNSPALEAVFELVERVAPTTTTVLIQGETGTGKELIAKAIHNISPRYDRPFVKVNCAAIPLDLLESELFGHERGAFTGAIAQKIGRFELADKGTLFLDEIGDIPSPLQPKLLRVLQEQEFERLGSGRTHRVDVRVVAATHRNLEQMVKGNEFRSDLYYRLNVFPVFLPPLRARQEDIPKLVTHFVGFYGRKIGKRIDHIAEGTMAALLSYPWRGNVRELQNLIERAVILSCDGELPNPLPSNHQETVTVVSNSATVQIPPLPTPIRGEPVTLTEAEREDILTVLGESNRVVGGSNDRTSVADEYERRQRDEIRRALAVCKGRVGGADGAAARLGVNRTTLLWRMKKYGIYAKQYAYPQRASSSS
jgi:transcriptional regulator with GAF, ATPase, and Fis domain